MSNLPTKEGHVDFKVTDETGIVETFQTWYRIVGDLSVGTPLITLHGGPGAAHHYLTCLTDLCVEDGKIVRAVILYDQIGCGMSTHLKTKPASFWRPELFMDEIDNLVSSLNIASFDLLGHSWGGMLGSQYAATRQPLGLRRLVISDSPASMPLWEVAAQSLIADMPDDVQQKLRKHEAAGTTDSDEYQEAMGVFYAKHLCRVDPMPLQVQKSFQCLTEDPTVYHTM
jgi:L-proline amide hydrolase